MLTFFRTAWPAGRASEEDVESDVWWGGRSGPSPGLGRLLRLWRPTDSSSVCESWLAPHPPRGGHGNGESGGGS